MSQASLDALGTSVAGAVAGARRDLLQAQIELALVQGQTVIMFVRPSSQGGQLETVRAIVADAVASYPASSKNRGNAQQKLTQGDAALAAGNYPQAYHQFSDAYRALVM